ncbi:hypothetical protein FMEXI_5495 [Fusarium mexicanum]|uniref:Uncharacterized protein n=1 Tax=Fusarium mexicanum TaxID=751941 RepID=A0A8H5MZH3_9HYPO|nr:hypothetical protein FMEXI_5495 [Fusarium mexicanum]
MEFKLDEHNSDVSAHALGFANIVSCNMAPATERSNREIGGRFRYDKAKAIADSSRASSPGLWLAFYDPALDINQALEGGNTRLHLIDANGEVAINLGITRRQKQGEGLFYDYQLAISSVPSLDLNCDTSSGSNSACFVSLLVQFPNFERRTLRTEPTLGWTDAIAEAGAWFSFFQIVGWIFSGMSVKV